MWCAKRGSRLCPMYILCPRGPARGLQRDIPLRSIVLSVRSFRFWFQMLCFRGRRMRTRIQCRSGSCSDQRCPVRCTARIRRFRFFNNLLKYYLVNGSRPIGKIKFKQVSDHLSPGYVSKIMKRNTLFSSDICTGRFIDCSSVVSCKSIVISSLFCSETIRIFFTLEFKLNKLGFEEEI